MKRALTARHVAHLAIYPQKSNSTQKLRFIALWYSSNTKRNFFVSLATAWLANNCVVWWKVSVQKLFTFFAFIIHIFNLKTHVFKPRWIWQRFLAMSTWLKCIIVNIIVIKLIIINETNYENSNHRLATQRCLSSNRKLHISDSEIGEYTFIHSSIYC